MLFYRKLVVVFLLTEHWNMYFCVCSYCDASTQKTSFAWIPFVSSFRNFWIIISQEIIKTTCDISNIQDDRGTLNKLLIICKIVDPRAMITSIHGISSGYYLSFTRMFHEYSQPIPRIVKITLAAFFKFHGKFRSPLCNKIDSGKNYQRSKMPICKSLWNEFDPIFELMSEDANIIFQMALPISVYLQQQTHPSVWLHCMEPSAQITLKFIAALIN